MSLNCNELNLVLSELDIEGSFIQEVVQPGYDSLAFRLVKNGSLFTLLVCTAAGVCRMHRTEQRIPKNAKPLRFHEFLRARVQGMRINSCRQVGLDRIVKLDVSTWQERCFLYIRLWSGAANVIVTDENGTILDCMYRRPKRGEVSGGTFAAEYKAVDASERDMALERFPVRSFEGLSFAPGVVDFNQKIDAFYAEHATSLSRDVLLAQAYKWYSTRREKMEGALARLEEKQAHFLHASSLKHTGDLLLAFASEAQESFLDCTDYETGERVHIRLDPALSVQENAANYYEQYKKAVSGREALEHDILRAKKNLVDLAAQYEAMLHEQNPLRLEQLLRRTTTPKQQEQKKHAGLHYERDGWVIMVGRTATENDELLRHNVRGSDLWLHVRDFSGGYVFVKARRDKTVPLAILLLAGNLAVYHSKARKNGSADLYYTQVKYLRRAKNGPKGLVLPTQEKNLHITLDEHLLRSLEDS